jgi:divalent metal cation (Fe/Co/Zn/Cd) transporter
MSVYEGIHHITDPEPLVDPTWNYVVLAFSLVFTGISWIIAFREFVKIKTHKGIWESVRHSKDPGIFAVLFEDTADILGLLIAFLGVFLGHTLNNPYIDGVASILIGLILTGTSFMLAYECKGLLIGESASDELLQKVVKITEADPSVITVKPPLTMHMGPYDILVALGINFDKDLRSSEVAAAIDRIEKAIRDENPEIKKIFIEAKSITYFRE